MRDGEIAEEGFVFGVQDCEVGVVAFVGGEEGVGEGRCWVHGEGGWGVEVFDCGLLSCISA